MAVLKCKMCGGELNVTEGITVCECEYCGSRQTVPTLGDDKKLSLFSRANRLRLACEFDKASGIYENIVAEFPEEAEAYWGLVLCKFGIEYVDDPATGKKVPTCHRSSFDSVMDDSDFEQATENADAIARKVYREEAKVIEDLRKDILEVSVKEEPYDIFICYKETDENGQRTLDSVLAQDVYDVLTDKEYRVFFSRISLEDKLGQEYEPYIFAALNSAKIMLAFGTDYEYFNAVWVKNEWSRFLKLMTKDKTKHLIPCYKDIDAYDMPKEFAKLQAQDMGKVGATQDLLRGIEKLLLQQEEKQAMSHGISQMIRETTGISENSLTKRAELFLEEHNWTKVLEYCERILDVNPENSKAYWMKELAERNCENADELIVYYYINTAKESKNLVYARRFADSATKEFLNYFDEGLKQAPASFGRKLNETKQARINSPAYQNVCKKIDKSREKMHLMDDRFVCTGSMAIAVLENGNVETNRVEDDEFNIYADGAADAAQWSDVAKLYVDRAFSIVIGLKYDGSLFFTRNRDGEIPYWIPFETMSNWSRIVQLYNGDSGWYGLSQNGRVFFAYVKRNRTDEEYRCGQEKVESLNDIRKICVEYDERIICIKNDGTVAFTSCVGEKDDNYWKEMSDWTDIVDISIAPGRVIGIKSDGTLVATDYRNHEEKYSQGGDDKWSEMSGWTDVVKVVKLGFIRMIALDKYGELLTTTKFVADQEIDTGKFDPWTKISDWRGLIDIICEYEYCIGLKYDGNVVSVKWFEEMNREKYDYDQADASGCNHVLKVVISNFRTYYIKNNGSVIAHGKDTGHGENAVGHMKLFDDTDSLAKRLKETSMIISDS